MSSQTPADHLWPRMPESLNLLSDLIITAMASNDAATNLNMSAQKRPDNKGTPEVFRKGNPAQVSSIIDADSGPGDRHNNSFGPLSNDPNPWVTVTKGKKKNPAKGKEPVHKHFNVPARIPIPKPAPAEGGYAPQIDEFPNLVVPIKVERVKRAAADTEFIDSLKADAPDIAKMMETAQLCDETERFTVEIVCHPDPEHVCAGDTTDNLETHEAERAFLSIIAAASGLDGSHNLNLSAIKAHTVDGQHRKKIFFSLSCTSEFGLQTVIATTTLAKFRGYYITFYNQAESVYGYRFQVPIKGLPEPFKSYTTVDWTKVVLSQTVFQDQTLILNNKDIKIKSCLTS
jgi:hypothetical protein